MRVMSYARKLLFRCARKLIPTNKNDFAVFIRIVCLEFFFLLNIFYFISGSEVYKSLPLFVAQFTEPGTIKHNLLTVLTHFILAGRTEGTSVEQNTHLSTAT